MLLYHLALYLSRNVCRSPPEALSIGSHSISWARCKDHYRIVLVHMFNQASHVVVDIALTVVDLHTPYYDVVALTITKCYLKQNHLDLQHGLTSQEDSPNRLRVLLVYYYCVLLLFVQVLYVLLVHVDVQIARCVLMYA